MHAENQIYIFVANFSLIILHRHRMALFNNILAIRKITYREKKKNQIQEHSQELSE
jgi:hypothetical protein